MKNSVVVILFAWVIFCVTTSCQKPTTSAPAIPAITLAENKQRALLGLRLVKTNWFLYGVQFGEEIWKITSHDNYEAKKINRDANGVIQWEEDYYNSGKTFLFPPDKGTDWESITVHYDYPTSILTVSYVGLDPSITALFGDTGPIATKTNDMSIADEILRKWSTPRL